MVIIYYRNKVYMPHLKWKPGRISGVTTLTPGKLINGDNVIFGWRGVNYPTIMNPEIMSFIPASPVWSTWLTFNIKTQDLYITTIENNAIRHWPVDPDGMAVMGFNSEYIHGMLEDSLLRTGDIKQAIQNVLMVDSDFDRITSWDIYDVPVNGLEYCPPDETYEQPTLTNGEVRNNIPPDPVAPVPVKQKPTPRKPRSNRPGIFEPKK